VGVAIFYVIKGIVSIFTWRDGKTAKKNIILDGIMGLA
jgi:hypothetical protein